MASTFYFIQSLATIYLKIEISSKICTKQNTGICVNFQFQIKSSFISSLLHSAGQDRERGGQRFLHSSVALLQTKTNYLWILQTDFCKTRFFVLPI